MKNVIKSAIDEGLSALVLSDDYLADMANRIIRQKSKSPEGASIEPRTVRCITITAVILLVMCSVALASFRSGWINWYGEWDIPEPMPTQSSEPNVNPIGDNTLRTDVPSGEYWVFTYDSQSIGRFGFIGEDVHTLDQLSERFIEKHIAIPVLPVGYSLDNIALLYNKASLRESMTLYETVTRDDCTIYKYKLQKEIPAEQIGYSVTFAADNGCELLIDARITALDDFESDDKDGAFLVDDSDQFSWLKTSLFQHALKIAHADGTYEIHLQAEAGNGTVVRYYVHTQEDVDIDALFCQY